MVCPACLGGATALSSSGHDCSGRASRPLTPLKDFHFSPTGRYYIYRPSEGAKVAEVLQAAREAGVRVFFLRHMSLPKNLMGVAQLRTAMAWQRVTSVEDVSPWFLRDSPGFQLSPEVTPLASEAVFDKITMSAFEGTPLDIALRDCGINALLIAGVAMEVGIEPTVRHAVDLGYIPIVVTDACGAGHAEAGERALASLRYMGDAMFTDVAELRGLLRQT
jgi:nicotinamidase-related amidase